VQHLPHDSRASKEPFDLFIWLIWNLHQQPVPVPMPNDKPWISH
jgi:hypothetical protein